MKKLLAIALFLISVNAVSAQKVEAKPTPSTSSPEEKVAREATDKLVAKYTLDADQGKQMFTVQKRKSSNLASIDSLKTSNRSLYLSKLESLQKGTLASIRRIMRTKEQVELYQKTQTEVRTQRSEKRKELTSKKASKEDIQAALLEIYIE